MQDTLSLLVSMLAVIISAVSLYRTRKTEARQLELQVSQAKLAEFQHKVLTVEQEEARQADLRIELGKDGRSSYFIFSNRGPDAARQVNFAFFGIGARRAPVIGDQFNEVFPIAEFLPGASFRLVAVARIFPTTRRSVKSPPLLLKWSASSLT